MPEVIWHLTAVLMVTFSLCLRHKEAANVGGSEHNEVQVETTTEGVPATTARGLVVSEGPANFTVQAGKRVTLVCQVENLDVNTSVSWLRRQGEKLHLISVNLEVYSIDPRYRVSYLKPLDWQLQIHPVNSSDQGFYECQISSHPAIVHSVYVHVVVPELEIADERNYRITNKFYNSGSTIELRCLIVKVPQPTQFIVWRHNSTILNYDTTRGGISVKTDILPDGAKSQLFIANVGPADSGNYTCSLGEETVTSVYVAVITGESPAAMQHGSAALTASWTFLTILSATLSALS